MLILIVSIYLFYSIFYFISCLLYGKVGLIILFGFNLILFRKEFICNLFCGLSLRCFIYVLILFSFLIIFFCILYCCDFFDDGELFFILLLEFEVWFGLVFELWNLIIYLFNCFRKFNFFKGMIKIF